MSYGYVYLIENLVSGKLYVGQTTDIDQRMRKHFLNNRRGTAIGEAVRKYGAEAFELSIIEVCASRDDLDERETYWIAELNTLVPDGYNLSCGGRSGGKHSATTLARMRASKSGENNPFFGKQLAPGHRAKISASMQKRWASQPHHSLGFQHSEETKKKMSEKRLSTEHWLKKPGAEHPMKGRKLSAETKAKMRAARLKYLAQRKNCEL